MRVRPANVGPLKIRNIENIFHLTNDVYEVELFFQQLIFTLETFQGCAALESIQHYSGFLRLKFPYTVHEPLRTWIRTTLNKVAISNHTALTLGVHALKSYLKLICEYELHSLPNKKVSGSKDPGKNYIKVRPPLVRHLLRNRLFHSYTYHDVY